MARHDDQVYVAHMLDTAKKARAKWAGTTRTEYDRNEDIRLVLTHLLQIIGEAARNVSSEFQDAHPQVPWKAIIGMRHKIVHDYMYINEDAVWATVQDDLPKLIGLLKSVAVEDEQSLAIYFGNFDKRRFQKGVTMGDAKRFFRFILPGLAFFLQVFLFFLLSKLFSKQTNPLFSEVFSSDKWVSLTIQLVIASGAIGFLSSVFYYAFIESDLLMNVVNRVDHSELLKKAKSNGLIRFASINDEKNDFNIERKTAWIILTGYWHSQIEENKVIKGANARIDSLADALHGLGITMFCTIFAFIFWLFLSYIDRSWKMLVIGAIIFSISLIVQTLNYNNLVEKFTRLVNLVFYQSLKNDSIKSSPNILYDIISSDNDLLIERAICRISKIVRDKKKSST